jgi:uncharacterized membrane protein YgcG
VAEPPLSVAVPGRAPAWAADRFRARRRLGVLRTQAADAAAEDCGAGDVGDTGAFGGGLDDIGGGDFGGGGDSKTWP